MRITANAHGRLTADAVSRTIGGTMVQYGEYGHTSAGRLRVRAGALIWPQQITDVKLTREHNRNESRGHLVDVSDPAQPGSVVAVRFAVAAGADGDAALRDAGIDPATGEPTPPVRDRLSYDIVDAKVEGDEIVSGSVIAVGQVGIPAHESGRIETVAAANSEGNTNTMLTDEQRARLDALRERSDLDAAETAELNALMVLAGDTPPEAQPEGAPADAAPADAAPTAVAAGRPAVSQGVPTGSRPPARTAPRANALDTFCQNVAQMLGAHASPGQITAAFQDVTWSANSSTEAPAWSGELWSGLQYEPIFTPLFNSGDLTSWEGHGWRWVTKPALADYAGDKAAVPSNAISTAPGTYEAARMAVGHDIDRKFYDFPGGAAFLRSYAEAAREDWAVKLDAKVEAYIIANAVPSGVAPGAGGILQRLARLVRKAQRSRLGRSPFVILNDNDYDRILDVTEDDLPAFLSLVGLSPEKIVPSENVPADTAIAGAKQAATVRTLPGSPIRVDAQHLANGGVDSAFFGYWAVEEHHTSGILSMDLGFVA